MSRKLIVSALASAVVTLTVGVRAQQPDRAAIQLEAARQKAEVEGDLAGAIRQYEAIAAQYASSNRAVAAQALLLKADAYRQQGDAREKTIYDSILGDFADQREVAATARARRGDTSVRAGGLDVRNDRVWTTSDTNLDFWSGDVSPDGRYLSLVDWTTGDLALHDFVANTNRRLTRNPDPMPPSGFPGFASSSAFSPDGRLVAYSWLTDESHPPQVRILPVGPSTGAAPRLLFERGGGTRDVRVADWSSDGKTLAIQLRLADDTKQIATASVADGTVKVLTSLQWHGTSDLMFSPDGRWLAYDVAVGDAGLRDVHVIAVDGTSNAPVVTDAANDVIVGWTPDGALLFESDRSGTPGLYLVRLDRGKPAGRPTPLKDPLPIHGSFKVTSGGTLRYAVGTGGPVVSVASVDFTTGATIAQPVPFTERQPALRIGAWSPDGKWLVGRAQAQSFPYLVVVNVDSGEQRSLRPGLTWINQVTWLAANEIVVRGVDAKGRSGLFRVAAQSGETVPIELTDCRMERCPVDAKTIKLIHSVSPDFQSIYYAFQPPTGQQGDRVLVQRDLRSGRERELLRGRGLFGFRLSPQGDRMTFIEPDSDAKSNVLKVVDIATLKAHEVTRATDGAVLKTLVEWTPDGEHLLFGRLEEKKTSAWMVAASGTGTPVRLQLDLLDKTQSAYRSVQVHPDNRRVLLLSGAPEVWEVWTLENFLPKGAR